MAVILPRRSPLLLIPMLKSHSYSKMSLLPTTSSSPLASHASTCLSCSLHTQQRLARLTLAVLVLALLTLLYLMFAPRAPSSPLHLEPSSSPLARLSTASGPSAWSDLTPPLSRETLGQATWALLHTLAALYPAQPTAEEREAAVALLGALRLLYPCELCRQHFGRMMDRRPPRVDSREELTQWMCETHNEINARLDKEIVDCSRVGERWPPELRECGCGPEDNATSNAT